MDGALSRPSLTLLIEQGLRVLPISPLVGEMPGRAEGGIDYASGLPGHAHTHRHPHGMFFIISWVIGIMLALRWCMTQSEPASAMPTMMSVKISAISVQPPSERGFMCRK